MLPVGRLANIGRTAFRAIGVAVIALDATAPGSMSRGIAQAGAILATADVLPNPVVEPRTAVLA
jgi:hypothetical protein